MTRRGLIAVLPAGMWLADARDFRRAKGFTWLQSASPQYDVFYEAGTKAERDIGKIRERFDKGQKRIANLLGEPPRVRAEVFVVDSRSRVKQLTGFESNGLALGAAAVMVYSDTVDAAGSHELCHVWANASWGKGAGAWIDEGVAVYSDDEWRGLPLHVVAKWLLDHDKLVPMVELTHNGWNRRHSDLVTYPQLGSFVKFLFERFGREAVKVLWQQGAGRAKAAVGKSLGELEAAWRAEVGKLDATGASYRL